MDGRTDRVIPIYPPNFVCGGYNNNFDHDDSVRKETENMIDSGSQDVQVVRFGT
jgi:hypothetical protein